MIYVTGDCHGVFNKLSSKSFPEQKEMTKDDIVIICGDFGAVWDNPVSREDKYWLDFLDSKPFTTVFCDGNHENFDMLNNNFPIVDFCGGKAHKIANSVYHLMRGEIFDFQGLKFFVFGGAASHDISDGILDRNDFPNEEDFKSTIRRFRKQNKLFRINHCDWWSDELPNDAEYKNAEKNLAAVDYKVDYIITHCAPQTIVDSIFPFDQEEPNHLTQWFDTIVEKLEFKKWYFGHYHDDVEISDWFTMLYHEIENINYK